MWTWQDLSTRPEIDRLDAASHATLALAGAAGLDLDDRSVVRDTGFVDRLRRRIGAPATLIVIGQVGAGKSSFVNSLVGRRLLPTSGEPTDGVVSVLLYAPTPEEERAELVWPDDTVEPFASVDDALRFTDQRHTRPADQADCREVRFYRHAPLLQDLRIVNTPGLGDRLQQFHQVALDYLHEDESDLIAWIFFPDAAANEYELKTFAAALERRRDAVLGIVTRSMDGHYDDPGYDPRGDAGLADVLTQVRSQLGGYLADAVLYDSRAARELVGRLRADPSVLLDETFQFELDRCGYTTVERAIDQAALRPDGQVRSVVKRCRVTTRALAETVEDAGRVVAARETKRQEARQAWLELTRDVIDPARRSLLSELAQVADKSAQELASVTARIGADVIDKDFTLGKVVGNLGIARFLTGKRPLAEQLNDRIQTNVRRALDKNGFDRRMDNDYRRIVERHLIELELRLQKQAGSVNHPKATLQPVGDHSTGVASMGTAGVQRTVMKVISTAAAGAVTSLVQRITEKAGAKKAEAAAVGTAARQATKKAATTATTQVAKQTGRTAGGQMATKVLSGALMVLAAFDVKKLFDEFGESQVALGDTVRTTYLAEKGTHERQINAHFAESVDELFEEIRQTVKAALDPAEQAEVTTVDLETEVPRLRAELADLLKAFASDETR